MTELERLAAAELPSPAIFLKRVEWLRTFLAIEGAQPIADRAAADADAAALRRVIALMDGASLISDLVARLDELEAALAVRQPTQRDMADLKEFAAVQLCAAIAETKGVPVALLQTGVTPDGVPPTLDTLLVHAALDDLGMSEGAHGVRKRVARAIAADGATHWKRVKGAAILEI